jgi:hypothetical protein
MLEKRLPLQQMELGKGYLHVKTEARFPPFFLCTQINSKWIKHFHVTPETETTTGRH